MAAGGDDVGTRRISTVETVFIHVDSLPTEGDREYTTREICNSCEIKHGYGCMFGAQRIGKLWRLYPVDFEVRAKLLIEGITLRGHSIELKDKNPFVVPDGGRRRLSTRVLIGNVPLSYSDDEIKNTLAMLGCTFMSELYLERDRDAITGQLTRWYTGRRFVYIERPRRPLPKTMKLGDFRATIYHKEQKAWSTEIKCSRCFGSDHTVTNSENEIVCENCKISGHKIAECGFFTDPTARSSDNFKEDNGADSDKGSMVSETSALEMLSTPDNQEDENKLPPPAEFSESEPTHPTPKQPEVSSPVSKSDGLNDNKDENQIKSDSQIKLSHPPNLPPQESSETVPTPLNPNHPQPSENDGVNKTCNDQNESDQTKSNGHNEMPPPPNPPTINNDVKEKVKSNQRSRSPNRQHDKSQRKDRSQSKRGRSPGDDDSDTSCHKRHTSVSRDIDSNT